jgi:D-3-phosphoglycerate dehydrogenase
LTPQTKHLINKASLQTMKKTAVLINVARGGVVQENDLVWALRNRIIHSAAMDVFEIEPLPADSPLLQPLDNLIVTPHLAAIAVDVFETSVQHMMDNITRVSRGEPVPDQDSVV